MSSGSAGPISTAESNFWDADPNLQFEVRHRVEEKDRRRTELWGRELGHRAGGEISRLAAQADKNPPKLRQYDAEGARVDEIEYHPAYHALENIAFQRFALAAVSHQAGLLGWPTPLPHVVKYALSYLFVQAEFGILCPVSMTDSLVRVLRRFGSEELKQAYVPRLTSTDPKKLWQGAMFVTEQQGGSDVGAAQTVARRDGDRWRLFGDKWFCSNVDAEVILTLARPKGATDGIAGLGMFLVPRILPDGSINAIRINRLKDKLGSRSIATGEVTFDGTIAFQVGQIEDGFRQMAEMINVSRLSNAMRASGLMRRAFHEAIAHAQSRRAFGQLLIDLPQQRVNLIEMLLEVEASAAFVLWTAQMLDRADSGDENAARAVRILTPLGKYAVCRRARVVAGNAMDVRGGNGYVEDWTDPRLVRDAHLGSIWEGSGNVVALDVLRAIRRDDAANTLFIELEQVAATCTHPVLAPLLAKLAEMRESLLVRAREIASRDRLLREPLAKALSDALYDVTVATLLVQEAQWLLDDDGSARKLTVARLFLESHLEPRDPLSVRVPTVSGEEFGALFEWMPVRP